jgi:hypothetical protein
MPILEVIMTISRRRVQAFLSRQRLSRAVFGVRNVATFRNKYGVYGVLEGAGLILGSGSSGRGCFGGSAAFRKR